MDKKKAVLFYQIVIVVSCIILSWGLSKIALFTQYEFRELINWGNRYDYEADWKGKPPGILGDEETLIEDNKDEEGQRVKIGISKITSIFQESGKNKTKLFTTIVATAFITFFTVRYIQKKRRKKKKEPLPTLHRIKQMKSKEDVNIESEEESTFIHNEIRQELIQWEKRLYEHERRKSYETVQQWFQRIGKSSKIIPIYEKVRYGEKKYSMSDLETVRRWMKE